MVEFLTEYWVELILSIISAGALAACKYAFNQLKNYKKLLEQQDQNEITVLIQKELEPIKESIQTLGQEVSKTKDLYHIYLDAIVEFYKFKLVKMCKNYLEQEYITTAQFEQLSELHKIYNRLGGNSQGDEYYEKAKRLPVRDE